MVWQYGTGPRRCVCACARISVLLSFPASSVPGVDSPPAIPLFLPSAASISPSCNSMKPYGTQFTPWVVYNKQTQTFVLWFNAYLNGCCAGNFGVATSTDGLNFTLLSSNIAGTYSAVDCNALFIDDDGVRRAERVSGHCFPLLVPAGDGRPTSSANSRIPPNTTPTLICLVV